MGRLRPTPRFASAFARRQAGGFLLELSLVMLVVGVLTVATFEIQSEMRKRQQTSDARSLLNSIDAAIRAFVIREHRLPCPAANGGATEVGGGNVDCVARVGEVPFATLNMDIPRLAQNRVLRYGVAPGLSDVNAAGLMVNAEAHSRVNGETTRPYVAGRDALRLLGLCTDVAQNPAYALMWMPAPGTSGAQDVPTLCFRESADQSIGFTAVSGLEFFGWLQANLRH